MWIAAHIHTYEYIEGAPAVTVPDNTKTGVMRPDYYEPDLNRTYAELAAHHGTTIIPTRVHRPRDRAKVETADASGYVRSRGSPGGGEAGRRASDFGRYVTVRRIIVTTLVTTLRRGAATPLAPSGEAGHERVATSAGARDELAVRTPRSPPVRR